MEPSRELLRGQTNLISQTGSAPHRPLAGTAPLRQGKGLQTARPRQLGRPRGYDVKHPAYLTRPYMAERTRMNLIPLRNQYNMAGPHRRSRPHRIADEVSVCRPSDDSRLSVVRWPRRHCPLSCVCGAARFSALLRLLRESSRVSWQSAQSQPRAGAFDGQFRSEVQENHSSSISPALRTAICRGGSGKASKPFSRLFIEHSQLLAQFNALRGQRNYPGKGVPGDAMLSKRSRGRFQRPLHAGRSLSSLEISSLNPIAFPSARTAISKTGRRV